MAVQHVSITVVRVIQQVFEIAPCCDAPCAAKGLGSALETFGGSS